MARPLSFLDYAFFVLESAQRPMNVGPLMVLAPPPRRGRRSFADALYRRMIERPAGAPFDLKLAELSPTSLPALVPDGAFDLANHVHRITLPKPGTLARLLAKVCELHPRRLDRSRPLWDFYVIDGLADGQVAIYAKMHHGIVDGAGFVKIIAQWLSASPDDPEVRAMWEGVEDATGARGGERTLAQQFGKLLQTGTSTAGTALSLIRLLWRQSLGTFAGGEGSTLPWVLTPGVLKTAPSARRALAYCTLPLARLKALGKSREATVNDMLLTVLDMAMHRYLGRMGTAPAAPLVVDMPVALGAGGSGGNRVALVQMPLGAPGLDPAARLEAIRARTQGVKAQVPEAADAMMLHSVLSHGLPSLWEAVGWHDAPPLANLVASNPFGFTEKRYLMGAEIKLVVPVSVVAPGQVLNVTAVNYADDYQIAFLAIAEGLPRLDRLASDTAAAFEELAAALGDRRTGGAKRKSRSTAGRAAAGKRAPKPVQARHKRSPKRAGG